MADEGLRFELEHVFDIDPSVRLVRFEEIDGLDVPRFESFVGKEFREFEGQFRGETPVKSAASGG